VGHNSGTFGTNRAHPINCAAQQTWNLGTIACRKFRYKIFSAHPQFALTMASSYARIAGEMGYVEANLNLLGLNERLQINDLNLSMPADELKAFAQQKAELCKNMALQSQHDSERAYLACSALVSEYGIKPPSVKEHKGYLASCVNRMGCERWWKRKLSTLQKHAIESVARDLGLVHRKSSPYSSKHSQLDRTRQKQETLAYLENTYLCNEEQEVYSLKELYDKSVSNPYIRRAELMTRIKGFEIVADQLGHTGQFYTITTPSRMHARLHDGRKNPNYDGSNPASVNRYLQKMWARIRAKFDRDGLHVYGFRVAEPNHDGTPHWHMLFFMDGNICDKVKNILRAYSLKVDGNEKGAAKHRFKAEKIDKSKGTAAGYIAKYISKNIDGEHIEKDLDGNNSKSTAAAIDTWASRWGIRQFQQIGGPSVTVWRELRRLSRQKAEVSDPLLNEATQHAAAADWAAYVMVMGGPQCRREGRPISPYYQQEEFIDKTTGAFIEEGLTAYGDPAPARIKGILVNHFPVITHTKKWKLSSTAPPFHTSFCGAAAIEV